MIVELLTAIAFQYTTTDEEMAARRIFFDAIVVRIALDPCTIFFPEMAETFSVAAEQWRNHHARQIQQGEDSFRAEANEMGEEFNLEEFDLPAAQAQMTEVLGGFTLSKRMSWCRENLQMNDEQEGTDY